MFKIFSKSNELDPSEYKYAFFTYRHLRMKMGEVIEAVFGGYPEDKYIFYPPSDELVDYYTDARNRFLEIDRLPKFMELPVTDIRLFKLNSNYKDLSLLWKALKKDVHEEDKMLLKNTRFDYSLPDDLQVAFNKIDQLIKDHTDKKNKILKAYNIYPSDELLKFGAKDSNVKDIYLILSRANGEAVSLKDISEKTNNMPFPLIRINISHLKEKIKDQHKDNLLRIENQRQSAYRLIIS